jgi:hypothetical protein
MNASFSAFGLLIVAGLVVVAVAWAASVLLRRGSDDKHER